MSQEKRYTKEEYLKELMKFHNSKPRLENESDFEDYLKNTTVERYAIGDKVLSEVQQLLTELSESASGKEKLKIQEAMKKVDQGVISLSYGALRYNKAVEPENVMLWPGDGPFIRDKK